MKEFFLKLFLPFINVFHRFVYSSSVHSSRHLAALFVLAQKIVSGLFPQSHQDLSGLMSTSPVLSPVRQYTFHCSLDLLYHTSTMLLEEIAYSLKWGEEKMLLALPGDSGYLLINKLLH